MILNATPETIRNVTEVCKYAGYLDDHFAKADTGRIAAWSEQIHRHNLTRDDLMDGLQAYYDQPHDKSIGIGDLIAHARTAKRARVDKEADAIREARRAQQDARLDEIAAVQADALAPAGPPKINTPRLQAARTALDNCHGRDCKPAIAEYHAALKEARKGPRYTPTTVPADTTSPTS